MSRLDIHRYIKALYRQIIKPMFRKNRWKRFKQRRKYGFDERVTWNLDMEIIKFILPRLKMYVEVAGEFVDLEHKEFNTVEWRGCQIPLKEAIEIVIVEMDKIDEDEYSIDSEEALMLFGKIIPYLWW